MIKLVIGVDGLKMVNKLKIDKASFHELSLGLTQIDIIREKMLEEAKKLNERNRVPER